MEYMPLLRLQHLNPEKFEHMLEGFFQGSISFLSFGKKVKDIFSVCRRCIALHEHELFEEPMISKNFTIGEEDLFIRESILLDEEYQQLHSWRSF